MATHQLAQGLASLGRNGDSMLVHMSPEEVGGLQQIGNSLGIKMSTNPNTGMPEAFSFGDFFTSFLPTIVGAAVGGPGGAGIMSQMTPILAGAGTGALLAAAKGDDPLMGGLTGGLGGYGGSQLGQSFGKAFGQGTTAGSMGDLVKQGVTNLNPTVGQSGIVGATGQLGPDMSFGVAGKQAADLTTQALPNFATAPNFTPTAPLSPTAQMAQNLGDLGSGVKNLTGFGDMSISDAYGKFTQAGGTAGQLAMPVGGAVLAGLEPSDLGYGTGNLYEDPDKGKYRGPQGQLNLSDKFNTGLRLAEGGSITAGGIRDLYGTRDDQLRPNLSTDGYGLGRLNSLAGEQAMTQAQSLGYAEGGDVADSSTKGITTAEGIASIDPSRVRGDMVDDMAGLPYTYDRVITPGALDFYRISPLEYNPEVYAGSLRRQEGMAKGGDVVAGEKGMNLDQLSTLNVNTGTSILNNQTPSDSNISYTEDFLPGGFGLMRDLAKSKGFLPGGLDLIRSQINSSDFNPSMTTYKNMVRTSQMAKGGYLDGQGDGMSDSIPATIDGKQPARLADGEFVVPADVVSHLGNGSSKAGSKRLYAMLDKVRQARTGTKKQGKEINPAKYMPA